MMLAVVWRQACTTGRAAEPACADLADLTAEQQRTTNCMLSALGKVPGAGNAVLRIAQLNAFDGGPSKSIYLFVDYTYRHHDRTIAPSMSFQEIEVTSLVAKRSGMFLLSGLCSASHCDLNDLDDGMEALADDWLDECHIDVGVVFA